MLLKVPSECAQDFYKLKLFRPYNMSGNTVDVIEKNKQSIKLYSNRIKQYTI